MSGLKNSGTILGVVNTLAIGGVIYYVSSTRTELLQKIDTFGDRLKVLLPLLEAFPNERQTIINHMAGLENRVVNMQKTALTEFETRLTQQAKQIDDLKKENNELREQLTYISKHLISKGMKPLHDNSGGTSSKFHAAEQSGAASRTGNAGRAKAVATRRKKSVKVDTDTSDSD
jgi:hypothetical protein